MEEEQEAEREATLGLLASLSPAARLPPLLDLCHFTHSRYRYQQTPCHQEGSKLHSTAEELLEVSSSEQKLSRPTPHLNATTSYEQLSEALTPQDAKSADSEEASRLSPKRASCRHQGTQRKSRSCTVRYPEQAGPTRGRRMACSGMSCTGE